jgi:hypothetical protein
MRDADIENISLQELRAYQQGLIADIQSGALKGDDAKAIIKRIDRRIEATRQKLRDEGVKNLIDRVRYAGASQRRWTRPD